MATLELNSVQTSLHPQPLSLTVSSGQVVYVNAEAETGNELLLSTLGLRPITAGVVSIDGAPLTSLSAPYFRQLTGYAPADIQLRPDAAIERSLRGGGNSPSTTAQWLTEALGVPQQRLADVEAEGATLMFDTRTMLMPPTALTQEQRRRLLLAAAVIRAKQVLLVCHPLCPEGYLEQVAQQRQTAVLAIIPVTTQQNV